MSPALRCTGTPISWLRLELHHDGLLAAEREQIAAHLAECAACAACFAQIEREAAEALPPLELPRRPAGPPVAGNVVALRRFAPVVAALALAALLFLVLRRPGTEIAGGPSIDPGSARTKGGGIDFVLVRDDDHEIAEAGGTYRDGDRWKALVTCPAGVHAAWDLVVLDRGEAFFPLEPQGDLACGNHVPLPGAFRTTGHAPLTVCLVWSDGAAVDREALRHAAVATLPDVSCKALAPAE
ncbi:MAG: hypothetical protein JWP97_6289 [Labilithrix sp.]|nr:hypothetical protein [Labilithrix sp.]